nr:MAG TPA: hypothetical protein [Caudoviricetes sp.]
MTCTAGNLMQQPKDTQGAKKERFFFNTLGETVPAQAQEPRKQNTCASISQGANIRKLLK